MNGAALNPMAFRAGLIKRDLMCHSVAASSRRTYAAAAGSLHPLLRFNLQPRTGSLVEIDFFLC
jgi:hypothetical protein